MSAIFKNSKKKVSQTELRRYMNEHKNKQKTVQKIDSPLANDSGQLMCILCQSVVRSESVWTIHINAKQHKENVLAAKKLQEANKNPAPKRPISPQPEEVSKRVKGILKNSTSTVTSIKNVPDDFFDSIMKPPKPVENKTTISSNNNVTIEDPKGSEDLPEGFFDDPKLDAKARNLEYKNPIEEEWEKFQKEIKAVDTKSAEIIAEDQEEATTERQIDEIEEQMRNWSRVLTMERKKEEVKVTVTNEQKQEKEDVDSDEDVNFDEFLDWRAKKS